MKALTKASCLLPRWKSLQCSVRGLVLNLGSGLLRDRPGEVFPSARSWEGQSLAECSPGATSWEGETPSGFEAGIKVGWVVEEAGLKLELRDDEEGFRRPKLRRARTPRSESTIGWTLTCWRRVRVGVRMLVRSHSKGLPGEAGVFVSSGWSVSFIENDWLTRRPSSGLGGVIVGIPARAWLSSSGFIDLLCY